MARKKAAEADPTPLPAPPEPRRAKSADAESEPRPRYTVIRDTREKEGQGWEFPASSACLGTVRETMKTGDYTLKGHESFFTIDRKGTVGEFATNVFDDRFDRELERMRGFALPVVLLEFTLEDIVRYPKTSNIPRGRWKYLRVNGPSFLKRFWELQLKHPHVHFLFAGHYGREAASSLFKRVAEAHPLPLSR